MEEEEGLENLLRELAAHDAREEPSARLQETVMNRWALRTDAGRSSATTPAPQGRPPVWSPVRGSLGLAGIAAALLFAVWTRTPPVAPPARTAHQREAASAAIRGERTLSGLGVRDSGLGARDWAAVRDVAQPQRGGSEVQSSAPAALRRVVPVAANAPSLAGEVEPFVRLLPMTDQELGTVRLARVRFRGQAASTLGLDLRVPVPGADGFVEADVLLGEDGLARAIRFTR